MSMRWLVPIAAASSLRLRSPRPWACRYSTAAASSLARGGSAGVLMPRTVPCGTSTLYHLVHQRRRQHDEQTSHVLGLGLVSRATRGGLRPALLGGHLAAVVTARLVPAGAGGPRRRREPGRDPGVHHGRRAQPRGTGRVRARTLVQL